MLTAMGDQVSATLSPKDLGHHLSFFVSNEAMNPEDGMKRRRLDETNRENESTTKEVAWLWLGLLSHARGSRAVTM